jgi:acetyltransferase
MTVRNLRYLFAPTSLALVGDIGEPGDAGRAAAENLFHAGFEGEIFFVNGNGQSLGGLPVYGRIRDLPKPPELAVIASPPEAVPAALSELGLLGTRAAVVISTGYWRLESGQMKALTADMLNAARPHLLRIVGPKSIGLMAPRSNLIAGCSPVHPLPGRLAFVTQSNAILSSVLDWATYRRIGFSHCVSLGNMSDVDFGDMIDYLAGDYFCRAILLTVESIRQARKFMSAARGAARMKPVILVKSGRYRDSPAESGKEGEPVINPDAVYDAAFTRAGVLRVNDLQALFDAVTTLSLLQPVNGDRLAILTNGSGLGTMAVDALHAKYGRVASCSSGTLQRLNGMPPPAGTRSNPLDVGPNARAERYAAALEILMADENVDAVLVLNAPGSGVSRTEIAEAVIAKAEQFKQNYRRCGVLSCWLGDGPAEAARQLFLEKGIPSYETPRDAVRGFMQMFRYRRSQEALMETPPNIPEDFVPDSRRARTLIDRTLSDGRSWLDVDEAMDFLSTYRIPVVGTRLADNPEAAAAAAADLGGSVILSLQAAGSLPAADIDSVILNLETADTIRETAAAMAEQFNEDHPGADPVRFVVRSVTPRFDSQALCIGMRLDSVFGPILYCGQGSIDGAAMGDTAVTLPPLNMKLAREVIARTRISRLLSGFHGRPGSDATAVAFTLVKLSQIVCDFAEIQALDINPLRVTPDGMAVLHARIGIAAAAESAAGRLAVRPYPKELEEEIRLPDGTEMVLRPIRPEDEPAYLDVFAGLSPEAVRYRFLHPMKILPHSQAARLTQIDYDREMAFVLAGCAPGQRTDLYGSVRMVADPDKETAEFAVLLRESMTGLGLGPMLMHRIIDYARSQGVRTLQGDVLEDNRPMLQICTALGFKQKRDPDEPGVIKVALKL